MKEKNPHAVALGKLGGKKGGKARAKALTPEQRSEIARKAARARWKKEKNKKFDMRQCKPGDKLISKHGTIFVYVEYNPNQQFPHIVKYPSGGLGSRTDEGYVFINRRYPEDEDIIGFA